MFNSQDGFLQALTEILAKQRPDISVIGRKIAENRSLKEVGNQLKKIYVSEKVNINERGTS